MGRLDWKLEPLGWFTVPVFITRPTRCSSAYWSLQPRTSVIAGYLGDPFMSIRASELELGRNDSLGLAFSFFLMAELGTDP